MNKCYLNMIYGSLIGSALTLGVGYIVSSIHERGAVKDAIAYLDLPELPPNSRIVYAHHSKPEKFGFFEWYGFEFETDSEQANKWATQAKERIQHQHRGTPAVVIHADSLVDFSALIRNRTNVQVQMYFDYTRVK